MSSTVELILASHTQPIVTKPGFFLQILVLAPFTGAWLGLLVRPRFPYLPALAPPIGGAVVWMLLTLVLGSIVGYGFGPALLFTVPLWLPALIVLVRGAIHMSAPSVED